MWAPREEAHALGTDPPKLTYDYAAMAKRGRTVEAVYLLTAGATYGTALCGLALRASKPWVPINLDPMLRQCPACVARANLRV